LGNLELLKNRENAVLDVKNGNPLDYRIILPSHYPKPFLTSIHYNNKLICTGQPAVGNFITTVTLNHELHTSLQNKDFLNREQQVNPNFNIGKPPKSPATSPNDNQQFFANIKNNGNFDFQCGIPKSILRSNPMQKLNFWSKGQFPWFASLYHSNHIRNAYICSGTLISTKIILTSANCLHERGLDGTQLKPEDSFFYLGKNDLETHVNEQDVILSGVAKFIIHPDWRERTNIYDADLAAALLVKTVQFTDFIKPACIWTATNNKNDIINKYGLVSGFGKTILQYTKPESNKAYWVDVSIVDDNTCLQSNNLFKELASERSFCAGNPSNR
jgi:hypothetical protein